jgi:hypothetical protein
MNLLYLDPGSGSFITQMLIAILSLIGAPLVVIGAIIAHLKHKRKRNIPEMKNREES